jgi:hypothetical protein
MDAGGIEDAVSAALKNAARNCVDLAVLFTPLEYRANIAILLQNKPNFGWDLRAGIPGAFPYITASPGLEQDKLTRGAKSG